MRFRYAWLLLTLAAFPVCVCGCSSTKQAAQPTESQLFTNADTVAAPSDAQKYDVKVAVAQTLERAGNLDEAIAAYQAILPEQKNPQVAHRLAVLHDIKGRHAKARQFYELALDQGADRATVLRDYGYSMYLQGFYVEAESVLRESLTLKPDHPRAHTNLGLVLTKTGNVTGALEQFRLAGCSEANARVNVAHAFASQSRHQEALLAAQDALRHDPRHKEAAQLADRLQDHLAAMQTAPENAPALYTGTASAQPVAPASMTGSTHR